MKTSIATMRHGRLQAMPSFIVLVSSPLGEKSNMEKLKKKRRIVKKLTVHVSQKYMSLQYY